MLKQTSSDESGSSVRSARGRKVWVRFNITKMKVRQKRRGIGGTGPSLFHQTWTRTVKCEILNNPVSLCSHLFFLEKFHPCLVMTG